jgi:phenol/toluene 2-monooxygenase (NADH) P4/A4
MSTPAATPGQGILCSVGPYPERQQDLEDRFYGKRLIYIAWENHLMYAAPFCVPLPPTLPFGALVRDLLPELYGEHPEFEAIDWQRTQWFNSGKRFVPDFGKSLQHHGLAHKSLIRFRTPKLEGSRETNSQGHQKF